MRNPVTRLRRSLRRRKAQRTPFYELAPDEQIRRLRRLRRFELATIAYLLMLVGLRLAFQRPMVSDYLDYAYFVIQGAVIGVCTSLASANTRQIRQIETRDLAMRLSHAFATEFLRSVGGVAVNLIADEDPEDMDESILDEAAHEALDHGNMVCAHIMRTDEGWELLRAHYPDGHEYGVHEPAHEER